MTVDVQVQDQESLADRMTMREVAEQLPKRTGDIGVTVQRAYQVVEQYKLPITEIGGQMYVDRADFEQFLETYKPYGARERLSDDELVASCVEILAGRSTRTEEANKRGVSISFFSKILAGTRRVGVADLARDIVAAEQASEAHQAGETTPWEVVKKELPPLVV